MKSNWKMMAAGLAMLIGISGAAFGQDRDHKQNNNRAPVQVQDRGHNNAAWNGDRAHDNIRYPNGSDHRAPVVVDRRGPDHDDAWYRDHHVPVPVYREPVYAGPVYTTPVYTTPVYTAPYYGNGYYGGNYGPVAYSGNAEQIGFQDGVNDGRSDRITGHSFRPTHDDNYKNADRGYNGSFGSKQAYKDTYRVGYERGYQEGYGR